MAISPSTNLKLLKVPLTLNNKNQLTFSSKQAQFNYFNSLPKLEIDEISYIRKNSVIDYPDHIDNLLEYNYCIYQNENYGNKWFYAFITNMIYENDYCTKIYISTDVFQTWQFDLNFKQSFVEREMCSIDEDVPGFNLITENFEIGEVKQQKNYKFDDFKPLAVLAYADSQISIEDVGTSTTYNFNGGKYNGIFNGVLFIVSTQETLQEILNEINHKGNSDKIMTIFTIPKFACPDAINNDITNTDYFAISGDYDSPILEKTLDNVPNTLDGYTPRNQKLKTYPFTYLGFNPPNSTQKIYKFENFNGNPKFKIISEINQSPNICLIPQNYNGIENNTSDMCSLSGYPTLSWKTDYYNTWLAQNQTLLKLDYSRNNYNYEISKQKQDLKFWSNNISNALDLNASGVLSNSITSGIESGSLTTNHDYDIANTIAQVQKQQLLPDSGSLGSSNTTILGYDMLNIFSVYTIRKQFAEKIDKYFDMYGYSTNLLKVPNLNNRPNWNYIKTLGANILANIPQQDLQTIKNLFDNGITLWHNPNTFLDYSQNNR